VLDTTCAVSRRFASAEVAYAKFDLLNPCPAEGGKQAANKPHAATAGCLPDSPLHKESFSKIAPSVDAQQDSAHLLTGGYEYADVNEQDDGHLEASQISAGAATLTMLESRNAGEESQEDGGRAALKNKVKRSLFNDTSSPVESGAKTSGAGGGHSSMAHALEADADSALVDTSLLYIESHEAASTRSQQGSSSAADDRRRLATAQHTRAAARALAHDVPEASAEREKARERDATLRTEPARPLMIRNTLSAERSSASNPQARVGAVPTRVAGRGLARPAKSTRVGPAPPSRARWVLGLHSIAIRPGIAQQYVMRHVMGACYSDRWLWPADVRGGSHHAHLP
jgi:hypothetical protein